MANQTLHVFSHGKNVIFIDENDYSAFNNRVGFMSDYFNLDIIVFTIMSSHFHMIVETSSIQRLNDFIFYLRRAYAMYFSRRYHVSLVKHNLEISSVLLPDKDAIEAEVAYVLKNPEHHLVTPYASQYEYSSASILFMEDLIGSAAYRRYISSLKKVSSLTAIERRSISRFWKVPDNWLVDNNLKISQLSFVNIDKARAIWKGSLSKYMDCLRFPARDAQKRVLDRDTLDLTAYGVDDKALCASLNKYANNLGYENYLLLEVEQRRQLMKAFLTKNITKAQLCRCLWL